MRDPARVGEDEFDSMIAEVLLRALDSFGTNLGTLETTRRASSDEEYREFRKRHVSLSVERLSTGDLVIHPLHREQGGWTGKRGEEIVVEKSGIPDGIAAALRRAFSLAS